MHTSFLPSIEGVAIATRSAICPTLAAHPTTFQHATSSSPSLSLKAWHFPDAHARYAHFLPASRFLRRHAMCLMPCTPAQASVKECVKPSTPATRWVNSPEKFQEGSIEGVSLDTRHPHHFYLPLRDMTLVSPQPPHQA
ncbi:uncharacterized protein DS421_2g49300 [Arachis hypogaea]|nr:uncharacterized protein DS421_2g49300 [Arachis hypogaea]